MQGLLARGWVLFTLAATLGGCAAPMASVDAIPSVPASPGMRRSMM